MKAYASTILGTCCLLIILALYAVGIVDHTIIRHLIQTAPVWIAVALAYGRTGMAKLASIPFLVFWLVLMVLVWLHLLGVVHVVSGSFSHIERILTIIIAAAALAGLITLLWVRGEGPWLPSLILFCACAAMQWIAFALSVTPRFAHR